MRENQKTIKKRPLAETLYSILIQRDEFLDVEADGLILSTFFKEKK